ncbi:hypothetical protein NQ317_016562 [Molorchus minor]|uniref:Uncharacterized protein n=1 Tax=Molorchus minor TaxID=1323400 RepID=A0ABQ9J208_9CUCU|nr:hypothetical protein NQ317_016562 [Molorchus minor]
MCILEEFIVNLQELLTGTKSYDNNIIRKHTRKLEQLGDISFPLNIKNWHNLVDNIRLQDRSVNSIFDCLSHTDLNMQIEELIEKSRTSHISIVRLSIKDDNVHLFLSRAIMLLRTIITEVLFNCEVYGSNEVIGKQINIEWNADVKSLELSEMDLNQRFSFYRQI